MVKRTLPLCNGCNSVVSSFGRGLLASAVPALNRSCSNLDRRGGWRKRGAVLGRAGPSPVRTTAVCCSRLQGSRRK